MSAELVNVAEIFGENVFNDTVMQERLPKKIYKNLKRTIEEGKELDLETADVIAHEMKEWAIEKGATHYTHWFQPLTCLLYTSQEDIFKLKGESCEQLSPLVSPLFLVIAENHIQCVVCPFRQGVSSLVETPVIDHSPGNSQDVFCDCGRISQKGAGGSLFQHGVIDRLIKKPVLVEDIFFLAGQLMFKILERGHGTHIFHRAGLP